MDRTRFWIILGLAIAAAGCWAFLAPSPTVRLLTDPDVGSSGMVGCYTNFAVGQLVPEPTYGTAIVETIRGAGQDHIRVHPVMWPAGYTGRLSGLVVEVLNQAGHVVARTGTLLQIEGGYTGGTGGNPRAFLACGYVLDPPVVGS